MYGNGVALYILAVKDCKLQTALGYVTGKAPNDKAFRTALDEELARMENFLRVTRSLEIHAASSCLST